MAGAYQPAYLQIAAELRAAIAQGDLAPGAQIPTEHDLASRYGVARTTVRQGLALLVQEGKLIARRPRGHFVRQVERLDWPAYNFEADGAADAWIAAVEAQGRRPRQEIRVEIIAPDNGVRSRLGLEPEELVVVRRRLRFVDDRPYLIADSYYPERIVGGTDIARPDDITAGARHILAAMGHKWVTHDDEIEGRAPTEDESRLLDIPAGLAVMVHTRTSSNDEGIASRVMESILPVDRHRVLYRIEG